MSTAERLAQVLRRIRDNSFDGGAVLAASEALAEHEAEKQAGPVAARGLDSDVQRALQDALVALSFCGKSTQARALNAQAVRRIKSVLGQP